MIYEFVALDRPVSIQLNLTLYRDRPITSESTTLLASKQISEEFERSSPA